MVQHFAAITRWRLQAVSEKKKATLLTTLQTTIPVDMSATPLTIMNELCFQDMIADAWVNIPLFDYQGVLRSGLHTLYMWSITDDDILSEEQLNPIGGYQGRRGIRNGHLSCVCFRQHKLNFKLCRLLT